MTKLIVTHPSSFTFYYISFRSRSSSDSNSTQIEKRMHHIDLQDDRLHSNLGLPLLSLILFSIKVEVIKAQAHSSRGIAARILPDDDLKDGEEEDEVEEKGEESKSDPENPSPMMWKKTNAENPPAIVSGELHLEAVSSDIAPGISSDADSTNAELFITPKFPQDGAKVEVKCRVYPSPRGGDNLVWQLRLPPLGVVWEQAVTPTGVTLDAVYTPINKVGPKWRNALHFFRDDKDFVMNTSPVEVIAGKSMQVSTISFTTRLVYTGFIFSCSSRKPGEVAANATLVVKALHETVNEPQPKPPDQLCTNHDYTKDFPCGGLSSFEDVRSLDLCIARPGVPQTYDAARSTCRYQYKADLLRIRDPTENGLLTTLLKDIVDGYWIGLHNRQKQGFFTWLDDSNESTFFVWGIPRTSINASVHSCVLKRPDGMWEPTPCGQIHRYVCQKASGRKPGPPKLVVGSGSEQRTFYADDGVLDITCSAAVEKFANIRFFILGTRETVELGRDDNRIMYLQEHTYFLDGDRCWPRSKVLLRLNKTRELHQKSIQCCWLRKDGFRSCVTTRPFSFRYFRRTPKLKLLSEFPFYNASTLIAECSAFVGEDGQLEYQLVKLSSPTWSWALNLKGSIHTRTGLGAWEEETTSDGFGANLTWSVSHDDMLGPMITSRLELPVTPDLDGARLLCKSQMPGRDILDRVESSPIFIVFREIPTDKKENRNTLPLYVVAGIFIATLVSAVLCICCLLPSSPAQRKHAPSAKSSSRALMTRSKSMASRLSRSRMHSRSTLPRLRETLRPRATLMGPDRISLARPDPKRVLTMGELREMGQQLPPISPETMSSSATSSHQATTSRVTASTYHPPTYVNPDRSIAETEL